MAREQYGFSICYYPTSAMHSFEIHASLAPGHKERVKFLPHPDAEKILGKDLNTFWMGSIDYVPNKKRGYMTVAYYPYDRIVGKHLPSGKEAEELRSGLQQRGLASLLEYHVLLHLRGKVGGSEKVLFKTDKEGMTNLLAKTGRAPDLPLSIDEHLALLKKYLVGKGLLKTS